MHHDRMVCVICISDVSNGDGMDLNKDYDDGKEGVIWALTLPKLSNKGKEHHFNQNEEWMILAGCFDGTILEWTVCSLTHGNESIFP